MIVVVAKLALGFAAKTQKKRELGANFDSIDSRHGWVANTQKGLEADNILLA